MPNQFCYETIDFLKKKINLLDSMINQRIEKEQKQDQLQILMSIPRLSFTSASAIMAEITELSLDEMIELISRAGYTVDKTPEAS